MKKFPFYAPFIVALIILPYLSCTSAPTTTSSSPQAQTGTTAAASQADPLLGDLSAAKARAAESRKRAADFEGPAYFPGDWEDAEALYTQAGQIPTDADLANHAAIAKDTDDAVGDAIAVYNNVAGTDKAITAYNAAADAYDSVFKLTIPLYAQAREDEIVAVRDKLIAEGGRDAFPEVLTTADKVAITAYDQYEAEDYYGAKDSADQALKMYQTLTNAHNAWLVRREIEERDFVSYDPDNFERAGEVLDDAMGAYGTGDYASANENANEAFNRYNLVLSAGWAAYAELYALRADTARRAALEIKADVAVRDIFAEADKSHKAAIGAFDGKKYIEAVKQFTDAEALFITSSTLAAEKRRIAAETIDEANRKIEESDQTARLAEAILEGGAE